MKELLEKNDKTLYSTDNEEKSSVCERWNHTIKTKMWKHMEGHSGQKCNLIATCIPLDRIRVPLDRTFLPFDHTSIPFDRTFIPLDCTFLPFDHTSIILSLAI